MINKKNIPLYAALAVPVLMILIVAGMIYLPQLNQKPKYGFVYMSDNNSNYYYGYQVQGDRLSYVASPNDNLTNQSNIPPHFYLYDTARGEATELTLAQAQAYKLNPVQTSPDGYVVEQGNGSGGGFIFGSSSSDYSSWFLKGHNFSRKLNLKLVYSPYGSYYNFRFLGWVVN